MVFNLHGNINNTAVKDSRSPRWFVGVSVSGDASRLDAAVVGVHGQGSGAPLEIRKAMSFDMPDDLVTLFDKIMLSLSNDDDDNAIAKPVTYHDGFPKHCNSEEKHSLIRDVTSLEEEAIQELLSESHLHPSDIIAVGVSDPGIRQYYANGQHYESLSSPELLAQRTGLNIIDSFPARDIAAGGQGGPLFAFPAWVLLKSAEKDRVLIDLGNVAKTTWIPRSTSLIAANKIEHHDIVPCGLLLDSLTYQLTKGVQTIDQGGRLTVQGCQIPELLTTWRSLASNELVWNPYGISPEPYLRESVGKSGASWAIRDVLCTATHLIAEETAAVVLQAMQTSGNGDAEIILTGGAAQHGLLLSRLTTLLDNRPLIPISRLGIASDTFDALCTAILGVMFVDQIPANLPQLTGSETSVALGRITPGTPLQWQRLIQSMSAAKPVSRNLRSAV
ncbi:MAG: anhydro-N-acetylmuramic acid kinase [Planctomycetaceae bacterium]|jgi:anhydro-N-acetylmuramic acid kinase|nr:anhydro-N-acetylmuramic acid kinase [Planctomycetaceae bacterium]